MLEEIMSLQDKPFCCKGHEEGTSIFFKEKEVVVLKGSEASTLLRLLQGEEEHTKQLLLAQYASRSVKSYQQ